MYPPSRFENSNGNTKYIWYAITHKCRSYVLIDANLNFNSSIWRCYLCETKIKWFALIRTPIYNDFLGHLKASIWYRQLFPWRFSILSPRSRHQSSSSKTPRKFSYLDANIAVLLLYFPRILIILVKTFIYKTKLINS